MSNYLNKKDLNCVRGSNRSRHKKKNRPYSAHNPKNWLKSKRRKNRNKRKRIIKMSSKPFGIIIIPRRNNKTLSKRVAKVGRVWSEKTKFWAFIPILSNKKYRSWIRINIVFLIVSRQNMPKKSGKTLQRKACPSLRNISSKNKKNRKSRKNLP